MAKIAIGPRPTLYPMPIVLVGALINDAPNYMPAAFVGVMSYHPPILTCGLDAKHYTSQGIETSQYFSVNIPSEEDLVPTDYCGLHSGTKEDKSSIFTTFYGITGLAPLIEECPVCLECKLVNQLPLGADTAYFGEIVEIFCEEDVLTDGQPDLLKIRPFVFTMPDNGFYSITQRIGTGWQSGKNYEK